MASVHFQDFDETIFTKEKMLSLLKQQVEKVEQQIETGEDCLSVTLLNVTVYVDYKEKEIYVHV